MTPLTALKKMVQAFEKLECEYCLVGGHAASLYRTQERFTKDVDFALVASNQAQSKNLAEQAIKDIGLKPMIGFIPNIKKTTVSDPVCMITSDSTGKDIKGVVDILLPSIPWIVPAVKRAQHNLIDLQFAKVPVITPEDLIIAKCDSLSDAPDRFQDLDDLKELFSSVSDLDLDYLEYQLNQLNILIPQLIAHHVPKSLRNFIRNSKN